MKLLIVGRTGTGKDTLQNFLMKHHDWKSVISYTTRNRRPGEGNTHIFITKEEAAAIPQSDKVAVTYIKNDSNEENEYFATRQQVDACDCYIIDPKGVETLMANMPDEVFEICYLQAPNKEKQKEIAILRANGDTKAEQIFETRYQSEDEQFTKFEENLSEYAEKYDCRIFTFENDYNEDTLQQIAFEMNCRKKLHATMKDILIDLKATNTFHLDDNQNIIVYYKPTEENPAGYSKPCSDKQFIKLLLKDPTGFSHCMQAWLSAPTTNIRAYTAPKKLCDLTLQERVEDMVHDHTEDQPELNKTQLVKDICATLENYSEFHEILDNYLSYVMCTQLDQ